ncbi:MAG: hypothetical protein M0036_21360 [Desulfobacteraceae bacterium]|nr:hypothetical protein [Desulfobacteraceae bacterium]
METIAVYWESIVRTYGFNLLEGLTLCQIHRPLNAAGQWGGLLQLPEGQDALFRLVWSQFDPTGHIKFILLCDDTQWSNVQPFLRRDQRLDDAGQALVHMPVDAIYFQGPHFGDRYGIMDYTFKALARAQAPLLAVVCSVATIYLVFPAGWGAKAKQLLTESCEIPKEKREIAGHHGAHR